MASVSVPLRPADWVRPLRDPVAAVSWSPDGAWLGVLTTEGQATLLDARGAVVREFAAHPGGAFRLAWNPRDPSLLATSGQDGQVRVWRPNEEKPVDEFPGGSAWVEQLAWSPDGRWLASGAGRHLRLWTSGRGLVHQLPQHRSTLTGLSWKADSRLVAAACYGSVQLHEAETGAVTADLPWKTSLISVAWSPDGRWVVAGTQELSVQIWELPFQPGSELAMSGYAAKVRELAWHPSGRYLATGGGEELMVWDCGGAGPANTEPRILTAHADRVTALAYQHRGHVLASAGSDGLLFFWNAGKSSSPLRQVRLGAPATVLDWNAADTAVAVGTHDGTVAVASAPSL